MTRRNLLAVLTGAALDPERLIWRPGARLISIPKPRVLEPIYIGDLPLFSVLLNTGCCDIELPRGHFTSIERPGRYRRIGNVVEPGESFDLDTFGPLEVFVEDPRNLQVSVCGIVCRAFQCRCSGLHTEDRPPFLRGTL